MEKRIFISHSSKDGEIANKICEALENNGLKCWVAPRDIPYGTEWAGEISKAISESSAFLFLSSGNSNASQQVSREIQLAIENELTIIPIKLDETPYSNANKYYLATIHCMIEYDAARTHKLVSDIISALPQEKEEKSKRKEKAEKPKKSRYTLKTALCALSLIVLSAIFTYALFFTEINPVIIASLCGVLAVGIIAGFVIFRKKARKTYTVRMLTINLLSVFAILLSAGIITGGYFLEQHLWLQDMDTKYHITLSAPENMTAADFDKNCVAMEERFDILMEGQRYAFTRDGDEVDIIIPREAFGGHDPLSIMKCYISRAMDFYMTTTTDYVGEKDEDIVEYIEVTREDIESATIKHGTLENVDTEELGIETETYDYIELVLKEEFIKLNADVIASFGDKLVFAQDKAQMISNYFWYNTYPGEKDNVYYLVNTDNLANANKTLIHNITNPSLTDSVNVLVDIAPVWENTKENTKKGENQCDSHELTGNTVTFAYEVTFDDTSEGEWADTLSSFKKRLDAMDEPYAFGHLQQNENSIVVRMSTEKTGYYIFSLLSEKFLYLSGSYSKKNIVSSLNEPAIEYVEDENGIYLELKSTYEGEALDFKELNRLALDEGDKNLYICCSYDVIPLVSTAASENADGSKFIFDTIAFDGNVPVTQENAWVLKLIEAVYDNQLPANLTFDGYQFDNEELSEKDFGFNNSYDEIEGILKSIDSECIFRFENADLKIFFDMPIDENLPQKTIDTAKKIFEELDFVKRSIGTLSLYFVDEFEEERARIFFKKTINTLYRDADYYKNGYISAYGIFSGGRLQRDNEVFLELVYNDSFFKQYIKEDDGMPAFS